MAYKLRGEEIVRLMLENGMSKERLAKAAKVSMKSLNRWIAGEPASDAGLILLAKALGTSANSLKEGFSLSQQQPSSFQLGLTVEGQLTNHEQVNKINAIAPRLVEWLQSQGIDVTRAGMTSRIYYKPDDADLDKTIYLLVYGRDGYGEKIWVYLSILIRDVEAFKELYVQGNINEALKCGKIESGGYGEPTDQDHAEIKRKYGSLEK